MADQIKAPILLSFSCPVKLQEMEGDDLERMCSLCSCKVQNISDYTPEQITDLQERVDAGENICVSFIRPEPPCKQVLLSRSVIRVSIAVAATISLGYYVPGPGVTGLGYLGAGAIVYAQSGQSNAQQDKPGKARPSVFVRTAVTNQKPVDLIKLDSGEYGLIAGRPAPNIVRDLVSDISYFHENGLSMIAYPRREAFKEKAERGEISVDDLEKLAQSYHFHGPAVQARKCYSLLLSLADREHPPESKLKHWKERVVEAGTTEYTDNIKLFDKHFKAKAFEAALSDLIEANSARRADKALEKKFAFVEICTRLDQLIASNSSERWRSVETAFELAQQEGASPVIDSWLVPKVSIGVARFNTAIATTDKELTRKNFDAAMHALRTTPQTGQVDTRIWKACNWAQVKIRLTKLASLAPAHAQECSSILKWIDSHGKKAPVPTVLL